MFSTKSLLASAVLLVNMALHVSADVADINVYNSGACHNFIQTYAQGDDGQDGECFQFNHTNDNKAIFSVDTTHVLAGCTVTVYTDDFCSDNAKAASVNTCVSFHLAFKSYSVDCGDPGAPFCTEDGDCE